MSCRECKYFEEINEWFLGTGGFISYHCKTTGLYFNMMPCECLSYEPKATKRLSMWFGKKLIGLKAIIKF